MIIEFPTMEPRTRLRQGALGILTSGIAAHPMSLRNAPIVACSRPASVEIRNEHSEISGDVLRFAISRTLLASLFKSLALARETFGPGCGRTIRLESDQESDHVCIVVDIETSDSVESAVSRYEKYLDAWCVDALSSPLIRLTFHFPTP